MNEKLKNKKKHLIIPSEKLGINLNDTNYFIWCWRSHGTILLATTFKEMVEQHSKNTLGWLVLPQVSKVLQTVISLKMSSWLLWILHMMIFCLCLFAYVTAINWASIILCLNMHSTRYGSLEQLYTPFLSLELAKKIARLSTKQDFILKTTTRVPRC